MKDCTTCQWDEGVVLQYSEAFSVCQKGLVRTYDYERKRKDIQNCHAWEGKDLCQCDRFGDVKKTGTFQVFKFTCRKCGRVIE
jgi:hypothetical protein